MLADVHGRCTSPPTHQAFMHLHCNAPSLQSTVLRPTRPYNGHAVKKYRVLAPHVLVSFGNNYLQVFC